MKIIIILFLYTFVFSQSPIMVKYSLTSDFNDDKINNSDLSDDQKIIAANLLNQTSAMMDFIHNNLEYNLYYINNISIFKVADEIMAPDGFNSFQKNLLTSFIDKIYYINYKDSLIICNNEFIGKQYNIVYEPVEWEILTETKKINDYLCYKAKAKNEDNVYAWFTSDINYQIGPLNYFGLPGLILQLDFKSMSYICKEILFDINYEYNIEKPKGIEVTKEEFKEKQLKARKMRAN